MPNTSDSISGKKETWNSQDDGKNAWNLFALYLTVTNSEMHFPYL